MSNRNLYQKLTDIMKEVDTVFKGATISMGGNRSYSAVNHDDVARLLHKPLAEAGIWTKVSVERAEISSREKTNKYGDVGLEYRTDIWAEVTFINADNPVERETVKTFAYAFDSSDKASGKAESMAIKYALLKNFMLESTDNEESRDHENNFKAETKASTRAEKAPVSAKVAPVEAVKAETTPAPLRGGFRRNTTATKSEGL